MPTRKPPPTARPANRPPHEPTKVDRDTVAAMVAAGIAQADIARCRAISEPTLRKHYKEEIRTGTTTLNTMVILAHIERIKAGDFQAIKWWQQARMGWTERMVVNGGKPANTPMGVIVEFVGEPALHVSLGTMLIGKPTWNRAASGVRWTGLSTVGPALRREAGVTSLTRTPVIETMPGNAIGCLGWLGFGARSRRWSRGVCSRSHAAIVNCCATQRI